MGMTFKKAPRFIRWCFFCFLPLFSRSLFSPCGHTASRAKPPPRRHPDGYNHICV